jgi:hypothetical protein
LSLFRALAGIAPKQWCRRYEGERTNSGRAFKGMSAMIFLRRLWKIP